MEWGWIAWYIFLFLVVLGKFMGKTNRKKKDDMFDAGSQSYYTMGPGSDTWDNDK